MCISSIDSMDTAELVASNEHWPPGQRCLFLLLPPFDVAPFHTAYYYSLSGPFLLLVQSFAMLVDHVRIHTISLLCRLILSSVSAPFCRTLFSSRTSAPVYLFSLTSYKNLLVYRKA